MRVVDAQSMQAADAHAVARIGAVELMRRAGIAIADTIRGRCRNGSVIAFAGPGNNGGDAFATCAELAKDASCTVFAQIPSHPSAARLDAEHRAREAGVRIEAFPNDANAAIRALHNATFILDGILGVGGRSDTTIFAHVIDAINNAKLPVCALDLPTGIDATTGEVSPCAAVRATLTVTLGVPKLGLFLESARSYVGELILADIGINDEDIDAGTVSSPVAYQVLSATEFTRLLPTRTHEADKRSSGAPLIVAGSAQFPGAAVLCARGAARAGAGYVTVATPVAAVATLRAHLVEQVVVSIDEHEIDRAIDELVDLTRQVQAIGLGPGMSLGTATAAIVRGFIERTTMPIVIDASGFAHIAKHLEFLRHRPCVLTPHESEFARLSGKGSIVAGTRIVRLREFVDRTGITTLLKGNVTLIYDGHTMHINTTGTNALATAGTGDVLTGMIATLLAQGLAPVDAARVAVYWHGRTGQLAAAQRHVGVMAGDLPDLLAQAALVTQTSIF